jgi:hypothetical protein
LYLAETSTPTIVWSFWWAGFAPAAAISRLLDSKLPAIAKRNLSEPSKALSE